MLESNFFLRKNILLFSFVVGAGTAGCVLASRLSEIPDATVLLIEAGGEENVPFYTHVPGAAPFLQFTDVDWQFVTVPQTKCCEGLNDRVG